MFYISTLNGVSYMQGKQFKYLRIPPHWEQYWTRYPNGYTILEALIDWVSQVEKMVDNVNDWNNYLDEFVNRFDKELQSEVIKLLQLWYEDGTLARIISDEVFEYITNNINSGRVNTSYPPYPLQPLHGDGVTDDSDRLQDIINYARDNELTVFVPSGRYYIRKTIELYEGARLEGAYSTTWDRSDGTEFVSGITDGSPVILVSNRSIQLKNFTVRGTIACDGIVADEGSFDFIFENVKVKGCNVNFNILDAWTYQMTKCRTERGNIGFNFEEGTSANINGCVAFQAAEYGFKVSGLTYTVFSGCGSDGSVVGLDLSGGNRGITFSSFGVENTSETCIRSTGPNFGATFTGLNIGNHSGTTANIIEVDGSLLTFTDFRLSTAFSPDAPGKILSIQDGSHVTLINSALYGEVGDIEKCTVLGGVYHPSQHSRYANRLQKPLEVEEIHTKNLELSPETNISLNKVRANMFETTLSGVIQQVPTDGGLSDTLFTVSGREVYICFAVTAYGGTDQKCVQTIMTNGDGEVVPMDPLHSEFVSFVVVNGNEIKIKNDSTSNTGYVWTALRLL